MATSGLREKAETRRETLESSRTRTRAVAPAQSSRAVKRYGAEVKGERLSILFDGDDWYAGVVKKYDAAKGRYNT